MLSELRASSGLPPENIQEKKDEFLKNSIKILNSAHSDNFNDITGAQSVQCAKFLNNFQVIYTVNYDLLLYWVIPKKTHG